MLANSSARGQTGVPMKNIPRTIKITVLIILSILLVQACLQPVKPPQTRKRIEVELNGVQVKDPQHFCDHLKNNLSNDATYGFVVVQPGKDPTLCCKPTDCSESRITLNVDQITKSAAAETSGGSHPRWGSHVTQRLASYNAADFAALGAEIKNPQP